MASQELNDIKARLIELNEQAKTANMLTAAPIMKAAFAESVKLHLLMIDSVESLEEKVRHLKNQLKEGQK